MNTLEHSDLTLYCIRSDYLPNEAREAPSASGSDSYWTAQRIQMSGRYQQAVYQKARHIARTARAKNVLDVGCGPATKLNHFFIEQQLFGVDTAAGVSLCQSLGMRGRYFADDLNLPDLRWLEKIPPVDLVICADVIEHLDMPENLLDLIRKVSGMTTDIVISTPARERQLGNEALRPSNPEHVREWASWELHEYLKRSGFAVNEHLFVKPFFLRFDLMTLSFLLNRLVKRLPWSTTQIAICKKV